MANENIHEEQVAKFLSLSVADQCAQIKIDRGIYYKLPSDVIIRNHVDEIFSQFRDYLARTLIGIDRQYRKETNKLWTGSFLLDALQKAPYKLHTADMILQAATGRAFFTDSYRPTPENAAPPRIFKPFLLDHPLMSQDLAEDMVATNPWLFFSIPDGFISKNLRNLADSGFIANATSKEELTTVSHISKDLKYLEEYVANISHRHENIVKIIDFNNEKIQASALKTLNHLAYDKAFVSDPIAMVEAWSHALESMRIKTKDWQSMNLMEQDQTIYQALKISGADTQTRKKLYALLEQRLSSARRLAQKAPLSSPLDVAVAPPAAAEAVMPVVAATSKFSLMESLLAIKKRVSPFKDESRPKEPKKMASVVSNAPEKPIFTAAPSSAKEPGQPPVFARAPAPESAKSQLAFKPAVALLDSNKPFYRAPASAEIHSQLFFTPESKPIEAQETPKAPSVVIPPAPITTSVPVAKQVQELTESEFVLSRSVVISSESNERTSFNPTEFKFLFESKSKCFSIVAKDAKTQKLFECTPIRNQNETGLRVETRDNHGIIKQVGLLEITGSKLHLDLDNSISLDFPVDARSFAGRYLIPNGAQNESCVDRSESDLADDFTEEDLERLRGNIPVDPMERPRYR